MLKTKILLVTSQYIITTTLIQVVKLPSLAVTRIFHNEIIKMGWFLQRNTGSLRKHKPSIEFITIKQLCDWKRL